ncbi:arginine--tRNA ligase, chloroplastic/mitochondrial [Tanacetum coccineum]
MTPHQVARKNKGSKASGSSTINEDALARLVVTEMTSQEKKERLAFIDIKRREVECREREKVKRVFESRKFPMIKRLVLRNAGILTFSLEGCWMAQRINAMLMYGIDTWAPTIYDEAGKAVFVFPANPRINADIVRAIYMKDALVNLCLYLGAHVGSRFCNDVARRKAQEHFTEKEWKIESKMHRTSLNGPSDEVYTDLATLWYRANIQKADVLVYLTPHRLRGYIEQCHIAAAKEGWVRDDWKDLDTLICCEFRTFSCEQQELCDFWDILESKDRVAWKKLQNLSDAAGYNPRTFLECALKFTCLKSHRLAECIFKYQDFVDEKGNMLASLLKTKALVHSLIKNSPGRNLKLNVLAGKERELGLHFVEFTEVVNTACRALLPHVLCEYLCGLSKLFTCCYHKVWQVSPTDNMLGLCEATKVVMEKCFHLLGIASSLIEWSKEFKLFLDRKEARATQLHIIPEDARDKLIIYNGNAGADMTKFWGVDWNTLCGNIKSGLKRGRGRIVDKGEGNLRDSESSKRVSRCEHFNATKAIFETHSWKVLGTVAKWIERVLLWLLKGISSGAEAIWGILHSTTGLLLIFYGCYGSVRIPFEDKRGDVGDDLKEHAMEVDMQGGRVFRGVCGHDKKKEDKEILDISLMANLDILKGCFLGDNSSSGAKKYRESNNNDSGNTGDGVKTAGGVIGVGGGIGEMANEAKRYLDKSSKELGELFPDVAGK